MNTDAGRVSRFNGALVKIACRPMESSERESVEAFAEAGGPADAFMLDSLDREGTDGFWGAFSDGSLVGLALFRRGVICAASATLRPAARALANEMLRHAQWGSVVGPDPPCGDIVDAVRGREALRVDRVQDFLFVWRGEALGPGEPGLRLAVEGDVPALVPLIHAYRIEDGLARPTDTATAWIRDHTEERIAAGHLFVVAEADRIVFVGAFNFHGPRGTGLGGIYTVPAARSRGLAARATASMCRVAFAESPVVTLHVNPRNLAALAAYRRAGLRSAGHFRLTFR